MKKKYLLTSLLVLLLQAGWSQAIRAQEVPAKMSLQESLAYALEKSEELKKAGYDEKIAENQVKEVKGTGLPQISGAGSFDYYPSLPTQILPGVLVGQEGDIPVQFGKDYNVSAGVQLTQLLFNKSFFVGLEAAKSTKDLYRLRREMAEEQVIYNVSTAYLGVLQTKEQFANIEANLNRLQQLEKLLELQYENELARKVDVNRLKVSRTNLLNQQKNLTTAYEQQKNYLKFFMGMPLDEAIDLESSTGILEEVSLAEMIDESAAAQNRIQYQLLNKQLELNEYQIKNIRAGYYPALAAYGNYSYNTQRNELFDSEVPWFNTFVLGLKLNVPIFDGFQKQAKVRQAQFERRKVEEDIRLFNKNTAVEIRNAISQLENSLSAIDGQEKNVALAEEVYETTSQLYKEGISPLTDLLEAEVSLREAKTSLTSEILKYKLARLSYLKARGELKNLIP